MNLIQNNTPVEQYFIGEHPVFVKREDLGALSPAPPFSKCRGLEKHLLHLKEKGIDTVGYAETAISMAGWAVACFAKNLGMKAIIFNPIFVNENIPILDYHRKKWKEFGAKVLDIKGGRAKINFYQGRNILHQMNPKAEMLPLGLRVPESIEETAREFTRTCLSNNFKTVVVPVGSGTICAGILKSVKQQGLGWLKVYGICTRKESQDKKKLIYQKADYLAGGLMGDPDILELPDVEWEYTDQAKTSCPFPCHPYYDLKAWMWLKDNIKNLHKPVLFWNIGSMPDIK